MALDPRMILGQQRFSFGLEPFVEGRASGMQFRRDLGLAQEEEQARARAEQLRQAYRQQYGEAPGGLAGPAPAPSQAPPQGLGAGPAEAAFPPLAEQEAAATQQALYGQGAAAPMEAPGGPAPPGQAFKTLEAPGGPAPPGQAFKTLEAPGGPAPPGQAAQTMGTGGLGSQSPSQNPFIRKLYTIDPAAGREAEKHAYDSRTLELSHAKERVEYLGQVADGVLSVGTQEAHNIGRAQLIQDGMPEHQIPVPYDPKIWTMLSGTARTSAERLREGELQLNQQKFQYEQREGSSKVPDYGLGVEGNRLMHARYGDQIAPGQAPTPAMSQEIEREMVQKGIEKAEATGAEAARLAREDKPLEGEAAKAVAELTALQNMSDDAAELFDPAYTGKWQGRWGATKEWAGTASSKEVVFRQVVQNMKDQLSRARSGANIPPAEFARLEQLVPNVTDSDSVFLAKLAGFRRALDQQKLARLEAATTGRRPLREQQAPVTPLPAASDRPLPTKKEDVKKEMDALRREIGGGKQ